MLAIIRIIERITGHVGLLGAWIIAPLIFATVYEVISRYVFDAPTIWAYELGYMATGTTFLLGAAYTLRERGHIRIDIFFSRFSAKTKALVEVIGYSVLLLPLAWWLSSALWDYAYEAYVSGETSGQSAWNPPIWPFRAVFFTGFFLLALQATVELIKAILELLGRPLPDTDR
jgi:TRAP-type mannitol/chloroaromatic compound transport system permease small subunit